MGGSPGTVPPEDSPLPARSSPESTETAARGTVASCAGAAPTLDGAVVSNPAPCGRSCASAVAAAPPWVGAAGPPVCGSANATGSATTPGRNRHCGPSPISSSIARRRAARSIAPPVVRLRPVAQSVTDITRASSRPPWAG